MSDGNLRVWGMIIPLDSSLVSGKLDLRKSEYTFGTGDSCDYQIFYSLAPSEEPHYSEKYSEQHFRLQKDDTDSETLFYIHDLSEHGTYVNGKKIGKNNKRPVEPNSEISLVSADNVAFIFIVESSEDLMSTPHEIQNSYIISKTLGKGAFGKVKLLFTQDGTAKVAMKCVEKSPFSGPTDKEVLKETEIMVRLKHPCIIEIIETINRPSCLYIIMELAEAGTLQSRLRKLFKLEESVTRIIIHQILLAVEYLHQQGITHRDLKPDNILLASRSHEPLIKVTDFGVSKAINTQTLMRTLAGTPCYIAPEIWKGQILRGDYSNAVDVWSIGIILYQCLIGDLPIKPQGRGEFRHDLMETYTIQQKFENYAWTKMRDAENLGRRLLQVEVRERILVKDALAHPWFKDEQSRRKVEELTGLAPWGTEQAAMNPERRSSLKEEDHPVHPAPSSSNNHYPAGLHYQPYNQPFQQFEGHPQYQPQVYTPEKQNSNPHNHPQGQIAPNYPYIPKENYHFDDPLTPNRLINEPARAPSPIHRCRDLEPPQSPVRLAHLDHERAPSPIYKPYQEPDRAYSPNRGPYSPNRLAFQPERPYSPNQARRNIQPRQGIEPVRYQPAELKASRPPQQAPAEGLYLSREEIAAINIPAEDHEAPKIPDVPPNNRNGQRRALPQQDAGQMTIIDTRQPAVLEEAEPNCNPENSPRRNSDDTIIQAHNKFLDVQGDLLQKKFKSQEELRVLDGPVLMPAPLIQPKRVNAKYGGIFSSPNRRGIAPRKPLSKINTRAIDGDRTPPSSPVDELPKIVQPKLPLKPDVKPELIEKLAEQPAPQQQGLPRLQQQYRSDLHQVVVGAGNLDINAKFEKTKKDVAEIHAQENFEQQPQANGNIWQARNASPYQQRYQLQQANERPKNEEVRLYPNIGAAHHSPVKYAYPFPAEEQPEYVATLKDIQQIQDVIPNYAADVVEKFLKMHNGDKDATINSLLHMMSSE